MFGLGLGLQRTQMLLDVAAQAAKDHIARVIADGGTIIDQAQTTAFIRALYAIYGGFTNVTIIYDPQYMGYKLGAGTGSTAGRGCAKLYALSSTADQIQNTVASQPLLLEKLDSNNYTWISGVAGNYFSTPQSTNNDLSGNFGIECFIRPTTLTGSKTIEGKYSGVNLTSQQIFYLSGATLKLDIYQAAVGTTYTSNTIPFAANVAFYARVSRNSTTGTIKFFTSPDGTTWTQLGTDIAGMVGALNSPSRILEVGSIISGASNVFLGSIGYVKLFKDDTFTTTTQWFNPNNYVAATSQSTWTSTTGEVWARNRDSATTGLKAVIIDRTMIMTNGTSHVMQAASFNQSSAAFTYYGAIAKFNNSATTIISELGTDAASASGFYIATNDGSANTDSVAINGNVGINGSNYSSNSLLLRLITAIGDTTLTSPETLFFNNNAAATLNATFASANNTGNMNGTALNLFARNNGASLWFNGSFRTLVLSNQNDNSTIRTAVYNFVSTYNNSAF